VGAKKKFIPDFVWGITRTTNPIGQNFDISNFFFGCAHPMYNYNHIQSSAKILIGFHFVYFFNLGISEEGIVIKKSYVFRIFSKAGIAGEGIVTICFSNKPRFFLFFFAEHGSIMIIIINKYTWKIEIVNYIIIILIQCHPNYTRSNYKPNRALVIAHCTFFLKKWTFALVVTRGNFTLLFLKIFICLRAFLLSF
jgi:hypothetical protein